MNISVKPKLVIKPADNTTAINQKHNLTIGQKVKLSKATRMMYATYRNADGTLKDPLYIVVGFYSENGVLISEPGSSVKSIVGANDLIKQ